MSRVSALLYTACSTSCADADGAVIDIIDEMNNEVEDGQTRLTAHMIGGLQRQAALDNLAMFFFTSCTPPERANNAYLQRFAATLGFTAPTPKELLGPILQRKKAELLVCNLATSFTLHVTMY